MVIEGAGGPAEINLKAYDIVNMAMVRHAQARVLLVGDIDRGGVFAALLCTWELLESEEHTLVAGFILNKSRGNASLLAPILDAISMRTGCPFLAVLPWMQMLNLLEEDSAGAALHGRTAIEYASGSDLDPALNRLAASVREYLDIEHIYRMLGKITSPALP